MSTRKAILESSFFVFIFFPIIYLIELHTPTFFVPTIEESLGRLIPLLIALYFNRNANPFTVGMATGLTFGVLEIFVKTVCLGYFSPLMLVPMFAVHVVNATIQSFVIDVSYRDRTYSLIPVAFIICVFWHWLYNAYFYVV